MCNRTRSSRIGLISRCVFSKFSKFSTRVAHRRTRTICENWVFSRFKLNREYNSICSPQRTNFYNLKLFITDTSVISEDNTPISACKASGEREGGGGGRRIRAWGGVSSLLLALGRVFGLIWTCLRLTWDSGVSFEARRRTWRPVVPSDGSHEIILF